MSKPRTKTKDPRPWRVGKDAKRYEKTARFLRRRIKAVLRRDPDSA